MTKKYYLAWLLILLLGAPAHALYAQTTTDLQFNIGTDKQTYAGKTVLFDSSASVIPDGAEIKEVLWNFGDNTKTTGEKVSHGYKSAGTYAVHAMLTTGTGDTKTADITVRVFKSAIILLTDSSLSSEQTASYEQQASQENVLLLTVRAKDTGPEALVEEELTGALLDARDDVLASSYILSATSGSVGANVLAKFGQHIKQSDTKDKTPPDMSTQGIIMLSSTPFGLLAPASQSAFDQLKPAYVLLTKPEAVPLLLHPLTAEEAKNAIFNSSISHRLLGTFSTRTLKDIGPANFLSFGINFLINQGVPINNITLLLMLPVIATLLSFSRQVIGIKAFGIITPALTSLTFLVMGLPSGLIVFSAVLLSGTLTRLVVKRLHLLYLPRMALVLTNVSLSILALLGAGTLAPGTAVLSVSIFPILILTLLAEDFIAAQFNSGARTAFTITAWTLALSVACTFIVSWQLLRTVIISYPEVVILCIPINILLGRFTGLRLTEFLRFRTLVKHGQ